jgi:quercetin dioxygenase-like cupin family protein
MLTAKTATIDLVQVWWDNDPTGRVSVNFPLNKAAGTQGGAVVYFKVEPGERLPMHTDSPEEILYIVSGTAEAHVGDEVGIVSAGDLAVIPAMVPHGLVNIGDETVEVVGFFSEPEVTSSFEEPVQPIGQRVLQQAPVPVSA